MKIQRQLPHTRFMKRPAMRIAAIAAIWSYAIPSMASGADDETFFETKIRPVLAAKCFGCHGPAKQTSGLRLDSREAMIAGGDAGPVLEPGKKAESLLFQAASHTGDASKMPPKNAKTEPMTADEVSALGQWIDQGAHWPATKQASVADDAGEDPAKKHWAFRKIGKPAVPVVSDAAWQANPVDAFIADRLAKAGISPSPLADRQTLIRRLSFDLTGLPPTPDEIRNYVTDPGSDEIATEKIVDRLLASPHFGERIGRHWLDLARYSDTKGYVFQEDRRYPFAYTYRDYVIRSFNGDLPYDRFVADQLAADKLPPGPDNSNLAAMGYLTVGRRFLNNPHDIIDDRIDLVGRSLMGLTIACARCHDHKYDPIPAADYYSLYGVFASSSEPKEGPILESPGQSAKRAEFDKAIGKAKADVDGFLAKKLEEYRTEANASGARYLAAAADLNFEIMGRGGKVDETAAKLKLKPTLIRVIGGRWAAALKENKPEVAPALVPWRDLANLKPEDFAKVAGEKIPAYANGSVPPALAKALAEKTPKSREELAAAYFAAFAAARPKQGEPAAGDKPLIALLEGENGLFRFDAATIERIIDRAERNKLRDLQKKVDSINATHPGAPVRAMVLNDNPTPAEPVVFLRGNPGRPGKKVPRQFLEVVAGRDRKPFSEGSGRLELARSIASTENPLTARVWANRLWMYLIGKPLVESPSDFGTRSDPPTHPELLDWLAHSFMHEDGWRTKPAIKRIVMSRTYRQSSAPRADAESKDPENRLVHRANRKRLELEPMRDAILAVSGRLDPTVYGPSVDVTVPPYPPRRSVYAMIERQNLDAFFRTFDFAGPDATSPRRFVTTVPQQALYLMNHPFVQEEARRFADRFDGELTHSPAEAADAMAIAAWGRKLTPAEKSAALAFLDAGKSEPAVSETRPWTYGFGEVDAKAGKVVNFLKYPKFTGTAWQFGDSIPHPIGSFNHLTAEGGHVGPTPKTAAIRRWTAPEAMPVEITGELRHPSDKGDGIRGFVVSSRQGILATVTAKNGSAKVEVKGISVEPGETIDFVVDCGPAGDHSFDSFVFSPTIQRADRSGVAWNAAGDFGDQAGFVPMNARARLAQAMLMSNAFLFVD